MNEQKLEEMIGESVWNTYRSMAYLIEAENREERIKAVAKERARRAEEHRKRTRSVAGDTSRLDPEGKPFLTPLKGVRKELHLYKREPKDPQAQSQSRA